MEPYRFEYGLPLKKNEIRLLSLKWDERTEVLKGTLLIRRLELDQIPVDQETDAVRISQPHGEAPVTEPYEALSYPWGEEQTESEQIWLRVGEDHEGENTAWPTRATRKKPKPYPITKNLKSALILLRSQIKPPDNQRCIWVDALCINQNNNDEKSIQIPLMAEIYSHAKNVCIWLGSEAVNGEKDFDGEKACNFVKKITDLDTFDKLVKDRDPGTTAEWAAFSSLLKRPWFSRRWIVQEIAVAREAVMYCGTGKVQWFDFANAVSLFSSRPEQLRNMFKGADETNHHPNYLGDIEKFGASWLSNKLDTLFRKAENGRGRVLEHLLSLEALMSSLTLFEAGNPRDTLYAILWLANDVREGPMVSHPMEDHSSGPSRDQSPTRDQEEVHEKAVPLAAGPKIAHEEALTAVWSPDVPDLPSQLAQGSDSVTQSNTSAASDETPASTVEMTQISSHPPSYLGVERNTASGRSHRKSTSLGSLAALLGAAAANDRLSPYRDHAPLPHRRPSLAQSAAGDFPAGDHNISYNGPELMIKIDYGKPVYEVCKDFLGHAFSRFGYIDMMCRPWAPEPDDTLDPPWNPPSWMMTVKDNVSFELDADRVYRRTKADPLVGSPGLKVKRNYNASGASRAFDKELNHKKDAFIYPPIFGDNQSLHVKGFEIAKVWKIGDPAANGDIPGRWLDLVPEIAPFKKWNHQLIKERPPAAFWRTLVGDRGLDGISHPPRHFEMACQWVFRKVTRNQGLKTSDALTHGWCPSHVSEFLKRVQCVVWQRRLVIAQQTEKKDRLLCLAPEDVEKDDIICILMGCSVPVVLREQSAESNPTACSGAGGSKGGDGEKQDQSEKWYKFIGECYVHDMMNGEVFRHRRQFYPKDKTLNERKFEIR